MKKALLDAHRHQLATAEGDETNLHALPETGHFEEIDPASRVWPRLLAAIVTLRER